jgi:gliding motility-associated-like protein
VITPESADVNSALRIFGAHYTNFEITIFSRWGEVIFNTKDDKNAWDGMYINENMPIGNYQWQVTYEGDSEEYKGPYKKTGDVAVVR